MKDKVHILVFIIFLSFFGLVYLIFPPREFSELENHYLTQFPQFSWKDLSNGTFTETFDSYTADQILAKDLFVQSHVALDRCLGITQINGVFFGKNGYLIQDYQEPDSQLQDNLNHIKTFAQEHPNVEMTFLIAPNASEIYPEYLPAFAETASQAEVIRQVRANLEGDLRIIDVTDTLREHKEEEIFYKTDHHWTTLGAYYAYVHFCEDMHMEPTPWEDYTDMHISESFYGSLYSKAPSFTQQADSMELLQNPDGEYVVDYGTERPVGNSMLEMGQLERRDKYAVFFGGNYPLVTIESNQNQGDRVLILKDSYANCLVPFLADHYSEIHMMDLRYYHEDVGAYLEEHQITKVIFIHNVDFLSTDNNFLWL